MFKILDRMPWLIAVLMFVVVIAVWTTFYILARKVPMQEVDRQGVPIVAQPADS